VTSSYKEPVENWVDSFAAFGFTAFFSLGLLRVILYKEDCNIELVPVDLVTSAIIACAWDIIIIIIIIIMFICPTVLEEPITEQK
jgi:hypothetical protein